MWSAILQFSLRPEWLSVPRQLALSHLPAVGLWSSSSEHIKATGTDHKPQAWDKLFGTHWESQKPKPMAQQGSRKGEQE